MVYVYTSLLGLLAVTVLSAAAFPFTSPNLPQRDRAVKALCVGAVSLALALIAVALHGLSLVADRM